MEPTDIVPMAEQLSRGKYPLTRNQMDTIKEFDHSIKLDISGIIEEWRITEMMCECVDLIKELEEMKRHRTVSRASVA